MGGRGTSRKLRSIPRRSSYMTVLALLALMLVAATGTAGAEAAGGIAGITRQGEAGVAVTVGEMMVRERQAAVAGVQLAPTIIPLRTNPLQRGNPQNPASPALPPAPAARGPAISRPGPFTPQTLGSVNFTGATLIGINPTSAFPPDSMGAAGPAQYVVMVNGRIVTFNKATGVADGVLNTTTDTFFNSVRNGAGTTDPRIRYDRATQRWFLTIINTDFPNRVLLAVSDAASQGVISNATVFTYFYFNGPAGCLADYPTLGIDANALYIGTNNFCGANLASSTFAGTDGYVVRKSSILGAGPIVVTAFPGLVPNASGDGLYTPQGVDNFDPAATEGYFIGVSNAFFGELMLRRVSNPGGIPAISADIPITTAATRLPITVPHLGNTGGANGALDAVDHRLFTASMRNGRLWTAHNIGVDSTGSAAGTVTRNGSRWYELQGIATGQTPSVVQSGTVFDTAASNPRFYWIPSVMVSGQGHVAMGFSTAGAAEYINAGTVGRLAADPAGTMETPLLSTSSTTAYNPPGDPGGTSGRRWGDYSYTSVDPSDDMTMWTIQEFCNATDSYGVRVVKLLAPPPATPTLASPATVPLNQSSVNVTITGAQLAGSGFFDPGTGFANRIAASVGGGVTVNSVTYTEPTHVTLNISTVGATPGSQYVTVTNPDGQSVTSATPLITIPPVYSLNLTFAGNGGGSVTVTNQGTTVCNGSCSVQIPGGTSVTLHGTPDQFSLFSGWSGGCTGTADCTFTMNVTTGVTATFAIDSAHSVQIGQTFYSTILAAYQAVAPSDPIIKAWGIAFSEALTLNLGKTFTLKGGFNDGYTSNTGTTTVAAPLTVTSGAVTVENLAVK